MTGEEGERILHSTRSCTCREPVPTLEAVSTTPEEHQHEAEQPESVLPRRGRPRNEVSLGEKHAEAGKPMDVDVEEGALSSPTFYIVLIVCSGYPCVRLLRSSVTNKAEDPSR